MKIHLYNAICPLVIIWGKPSKMNERSTYWATLAQWRLFTLYIIYVPYPRAKHSLLEQWFQYSKEIEAHGTDVGN